MPKEPKGPHYLVVNADESEPGTCKDRDILRHEPHKLLEGCLLAGFAVRAHTAYIYVRGEFYREAERLEAAILEAYEAICWARMRPGLAGTLICICIAVPELTSAARKRLCWNRSRAKRGCRASSAFSCELWTLWVSDPVNNVETIAVVPTILRRGTGWWRKLGRENNFGTKIFCISGHVKTPCNVEESLSIPLRTLSSATPAACAGGWNNLLAVIPVGPRFRFCRGRPATRS